MLKIRPNIQGVIYALCISSFLAACSSDNNNNPKVTDPEYLPIANPLMSLPPDAGEINLLAENFDLGDVGYQQSEYFLQGTATAFTNLGELGMDGVGAAQPGAQAAYKTRIVVNRPIDPADFSGDVLVEWLNVTAGFETPPSWGTGETGDAPWRRCLGGCFRADRGD